MKNYTSLLSVIVAAGTAGVALFALANSSLTAGLRLDVIVASTAAVAIMGFAIKDYSRRVQPLPLPGRILRPALPIRTVARPLTNRLAA